ncbi:glycosyltransferase family 2 protein [Candidatus Gottesmanbacteria bacterium]|nr:glycosyltransferase family 2 protein [Candidatus Gottesmanbacteria bacterium]
MKILAPVSVIITMRNSETTIGQALHSLQIQEYPIRQIIVIDNASTDTSTNIVNQFQKKSNIPVKLVRRRINKGVSGSYDFGARIARSQFIVFFHSDSSLESKKELSLLMQPFLSDDEVIASYPHTELPNKIWLQFPFWEQYVFARSKGDEVGFNGKFDCIKKEFFIKAGGFDKKYFVWDKFMGGEDADLFFRLQKVGKLVLSEAKVIHLHYLGSHYEFNDLLARKKMLARTYGRLLRLRWRSLPIRTQGKGLTIPLGSLLFCIKPLLSVIPLLPGVHLIGFLLLIVFSFFYSWRMYVTPSSYKNFRIFLLPIVDIFFVYYETFWMIEALLFRKSEYNT